MRTTLASGDGHDGAIEPLAPSSGRNRGRFALVVGNNAYPGQGQLLNAVNDARDMARKLREVGFHTIDVYDANSAQVRLKLEEAAAYLRDNPAETGLFYYSGHGMQIRDENFIIPVDIEDGEDAADKLVRVKEIVDTIAEYTSHRLVFLDACRDNPFSGIVARSNERTRKWADLPSDAFSISGLTDIDLPPNTLISFAAAQGKTARDRGKGKNSPFTHSLLRHIASVDLPITNLLQRVKSDVSAYTDGEQQPWYHSALEHQFFFKPGALISLTGNMLALFALAASIITFAASLIDYYTPSVALKVGSVVAAMIAILVFGMNRAYQRLRGSGNPEEPDTKSFVLGLVARGAVGAIVGSVIIVPLVLFPYFRLYEKLMWQDKPDLNRKLLEEWCAVDRICHTIRLPDLEPMGHIAFEMTLAAAFSLAAIGIFSWLFTSVRFSGRNLIAVSHPTKRHLFGGNILAGLVAGLIVGPLVTIYFAYQNRQFAEPMFLAPYAIVGSAIVTFAIVNYNLETMSWKHLVLSGLASIAGLFGGAIVGLLVFGPLYQLGVVAVLTQWLEHTPTERDLQIAWPTTLAFALGGAVYGVALGIVMGSAIAVTRYFTPGETPRTGAAKEMILWSRIRGDAT